MTPWTAAFQAPPSIGFSRQEYWSGVPLPSPYTHICTYKTQNGLKTNIRHDIIKFLEENIGKTVSDINYSNVFLGQSPINIEIKIE